MKLRPNFSRWDSFEPGSDDDHDDYSRGTFEWRSYPEVAKDFNYCFDLIFMYSTLSLCHGAFLRVCFGTLDFTTLILLLFPSFSAIGIRIPILLDKIVNTHSLVTLITS